MLQKLIALKTSTESSLSRGLPNSSRSSSPLEDESIDDIAVNTLASVFEDMSLDDNKTSYSKVPNSDGGLPSFFKQQEMLFSSTKQDPLETQEFFDSMLTKYFPREVRILS